MAVYTHLSDQTVDGVLAGFGLPPATSRREIREGIENTNLAVECDGRCYVLTVYERDPPATVEAVLSLTRELAVRGVPCPPPLPLSGETGRYLSPVAGKWAGLTPFVPGRAVTAPNERELEALGTALGKLHRAGADLEFDRDGPHRPEVLVAWARRVAAAVRPRSPHLADLVEAEAGEQEARPDPGLPAGVIHADLFLDNVLFRANGPEVQALLDFHLAGRGPWIYDLAVTMLDACWQGEHFSGDSARALMRGYRGVRPLRGEEHAALPHQLRRAALRFLCLRLERFWLEDRRDIAGVRKDPAELSRRLQVLRNGVDGGG